MLFSALVVLRNAPLHRRLDNASIDLTAIVGEIRRGFQGSEQTSRVTIGKFGNERSCIMSNRDVARAETAHTIAQRAIDQSHQLVRPDRFEHQHARARQERAR